MSEMDFEGALRANEFYKDEVCSGLRGVDLEHAKEQFAVYETALRLAKRMQSGEVSEVAKHLSNVLICMAEQGGIDHSWIEVVESAVGELTELGQVFSVRWDADMRAIKLWQETTGEDNVWPDHTDLVFYLMMQLDMAEQAMSQQLMKEVSDE
jgi:hypothetical protein